MSATSMDSPWVQREWLPSLLREINTGKTRLLPVRLDECEIPAIISDKYYADFRSSFLKGMSELINVLANRILEKLHSPDATDLNGPGWANVVVRIMKEVRHDQSIEVAFLLNALAYSRLGALVDPDRGEIIRDVPKRIRGKWMSLKGWNVGQVFTVDNGHMCCSVGAYDSAVGSFSNSLRNGVVRWVKDVGDNLLLFRWYQETSGAMGGTAGDTGFGVWRISRNSKTLSGIWWYEPVRSRVRHAELTHRAYLWKLQRIPFSKQSSLLNQIPTNLK
jgi:hypothetical protein